MSESVTLIKDLNVKKQHITVTFVARLSNLMTNFNTKLYDLLKVSRSYDHQSIGAY